ncbi:MAG: hypothetical protein HZA52_17220 [Planctomycetes bacterium]|nr:hypothetical protein [Planctomycetota bacterium]
MTRASKRRAASRLRAFAQPVLRRARSSACAAALLLAGCAGPRGTEPPWIYGLSRAVYSGDTIEYQPAEQSANDVALLTFLILPFVIDTVLLPITIPHDVFCVD